jgi:putative glutamine amidotransferase
MLIAVIPDRAQETSGPTNSSPESKIHYQIKDSYMSAILQAGGLPIGVPYDPATQSSYLQLVCGLLIIGGAHTIDPHFFGEEKHNPLPVKTYRTQTELDFFRLAYDMKMPILGICGGAQLINVALSGGLIQHLPTTHPHVLDHNQGLEPCHWIDIKKNTLLSRIFGPTQKMFVNSFHEQAIGTLGKGIQISSSSHDGIIESIESTEHPFCLGVQWHPEYQKHPQDYLIFSHFVQAAGAYKEQKSLIMQNKVELNAYHKAKRKMGKKYQ